MLVDFDYYKNQFKGTTIPQEVFEKMSGRAENELNRLILYKNYSNYNGVNYTETVKLAICSIADILYGVYKRDEKINAFVNSDSKIVTAEKVGDYSRNFETVSYKELIEQNSKSVVSAKMYEEANTYLGGTGLLNRGVQCV